MRPVSLLGHAPLTSWSTREAAAQEIEARSAEHLTLEHLETIDMPLHRTDTPGQGHAGFDRVEHLAMHREDLIQDFRQVLEQMKTVSHLGGLGRALASPSAYAVDRSRAITFSDGIARNVQQENRFRRPRNQ
jgi:hypothetical protein